MFILFGGEDNAMIYFRGEIDPKILQEQINKIEVNTFLSFR